jgi:molybdopterin-guanine dinucleotide biosynthesis protein A
VERLSAIVLAGGKSRRFGADKAWAPFAGRPLLRHVIETVALTASDIVVVRAAGQDLPDIEAAAVRVVEDVFPDAGPLGGLYAGLLAVKSGGALLVGCDMPLLQPPLVRHLAGRLTGHDAVAALAEDGTRQPLCAVYSVGCLDAAKRRLERGELRLRALLDELDVVDVPPGQWKRFDPEGHSFMSANTPEELARLEALERSRPAVAGRPAARCEVWYGVRRCRRPAAHRTEHSGVLVCDMHAAMWGAVYTEAEDE